MLKDKRKLQWTAMERQIVNVIIKMYLNITFTTSISQTTQQIMDKKKVGGVDIA
jgi:hypothetical protein